MNHAERKLSIVYRPLAELIPYARNARTHSDAQVAQIAGSIKEFGFTNPVLCDEHGGIIAGHGRVLAARQLGLDHVPTIELSGLTEAQRTAYVIADNKLALNAGWDAELLSAEFRRMQELGANPLMTGFAQTEVDNLLSAFRSGGGQVDNDPWGGMPAFDPESKAHRSIIVHCQDEAAVRDFQKRMGQQLTDKTKYIYHPQKPREDRLGQAWVEGEGDGHEPAVSDLHPQ